MDADIIKELADAGVGFGPNLKRPRVAIPSGVDELSKLPPEVVLVSTGSEEVLAVEPKPVQALWTGTREPPPFTSKPPDEYMQFFLLLEITALAVSFALKKPASDAEMEEVFGVLKRRPDGKPTGPMFRYLRGAARVYMSLVDTSRAEYEAVMGRLARSARHFADGNGVQSQNYLLQLRETFTGE